MWPQPQSARWHTGPKKLTLKYCKCLFSALFSHPSPAHSIRLRSHAAPRLSGYGPNDFSSSVAHCWAEVLPITLETRLKWHIELSCKACALLGCCSNRFWCWNRARCVSGCTPFFAFFFFAHWHCDSGRPSASGSESVPVAHTLGSLSASGGGHWWPVVVWHCQWPRGRRGPRGSCATARVGGSARLTESLTQWHCRSGTVTETKWSVSRWFPSYNCPPAMASLAVWVSGCVSCVFHY